MHKSRFTALLIVTVTGLIVWMAVARFRAEGPRKVRVGVALHGYPITHAMMETTAAEIGRKPEIVCFYLQWPKDPLNGHFPAESIAVIAEYGAIPCVTWEPMYVDETGEHTIDHELITAGKYDRYIDAFSTGAARSNTQIIMRFAHEMNLPRYHWGTSREEFGPESPAIFRGLYRYVVSRFRRSAGDVEWAFNPNADSDPYPDKDETMWNAIKNYYPGDDVVDILGMDGYNWAAPSDPAQMDDGTTVRSFSAVFHSGYQDLRDLSETKPLLIFETATPGTVAFKSDWLANAVETARRWGIDGIVWFQVNKERDWRILIAEENR